MPLTFNKILNNINFVVEGCNSHGSYKSVIRWAIQCQSPSNFSSSDQHESFPFIVLSISL